MPDDSLQVAEIVKEEIAGFADAFKREPQRVRSGDALKSRAVKNLVSDTTRETEVIVVIDLAFREMVSDTKFFTAPVSGAPSLHRPPPSQGIPKSDHQG